MRGIYKQYFWGIIKHIYSSLCKFISKDKGDCYDLSSWVYILYKYSIW